MNRPPMSDRAVDLLFRVLVEITNGTRPWAQRFYALFGFDDDNNVCGSTYCLAGNLCIAAGYRIEPAGHHAPADSYRSHLPLPGAVYVRTTGILFDPEVRYRGIGQLAAALIEVTADEAEQLFYMEATLAGLWEQAERLSDGRITIPADLVGLVDDRTATPVAVTA